MNNIQTHTRLRSCANIEARENKIKICSFGEKHQDNVAKLVVSTKSAICNECIELCYEIIEDDKNQNKKNR